jgi:hypothetical protein
MAKVRLQYVGPELREFGGKHGQEKFTVKAAQVERTETITNEAGDQAVVEHYKPRFVSVSESAAGMLLSLKTSKKKGSEPLFVKAEGEDEAEESATADTVNTPASQPVAAESVDRFSQSEPASTIEDKALPHVYDRNKNKRS